ncbi:butyrophilin subfamily 1 member A1-like isoform X2 [Poecilia reticulata]|uniref:butyrophilin subfamily 1 member A1-like isoform X2 n=1 Tax=Poecilia reticulata TaxID=8081 RepID=UPI0004A235BD|nr:PREDICTED: butyrophilin subfamily 1 member A1-like isoform X2 [Poecilia reticulata]
MASRIWHILLEQRLLLLLHLAVAITRLRSADAGHSPPTVYHRVVGENVTFYCPAAQESQLQFLYFQKDVVGAKPIFFNGYHFSKPLPNRRPNTEMDQNHTKMHIYGLNLSDSGEYHCFYMYKDTASDDPIKIQIYLNVTAVFSKPEMTVKCKEESGVPSDCNVTCHSHNGLSGKWMEWNVTGNINKEMWKVLLNDESPSRDELVSISSTANFNCCGDEVKVSCSVDRFTSETVSVCSSKVPPDPSYKFNSAVIAAIVICSVFVFGLLLFWWWKNRTTGSVERNTVEEVIVLNNIRGEPMGS